MQSAIHEGYEYQDYFTVSVILELILHNISAEIKIDRKDFNGEPAYEVWLTRAIIFEVGGREISFEKDTVPFSEEITIQKGYKLIDKIPDNDDFLEEWDEEYSPAYKREVVIVK